MSSIAQKRSSIGQAVAICGLFVAAACTPAADSPQVEDPPLPIADTTLPPPSTSPSTDTDMGVDRPETMEGTIGIEGMEEPMTYMLYTTRPGFGIPFSTYVPEDMVSQETSSGEGDAVRFVANFGGQLSENAFMNVYFFPEGTTEAQASERAAEVAGTTAPDPRGAEIYPWALEVYDLAEADFGRVGLGQHNGRYFYVHTSYPPVFGDGMGPRVARILDEWRWTDTGTGLRG
ncbi:MAG TPA: hypothetical protein VFI91_04845 [Longimicrobiaceae bacterium]|nr:hypothetical protein [Longimicrobiaceae bacterium]